MKDDSFFLKEAVIDKAFLIRLAFLVFTAYNKHAVKTDDRINRDL